MLLAKVCKFASGTYLLTSIFKCKIIFLEIAVACILMLFNLVYTVIEVNRNNPRIIAH